MKLFKMTAGVAAAAVVAIGAASAQDQSVADFYKGKTVNIYIGYSPGGGYDQYARVLAEHIGKHIPGNPTVVPQNMPGAGSLKLVNWLYTAAPQDGTAMGMVARAAPWDPMFGNEAAQFEPLEFTYVGSMNNEVSVCVAKAETGIETVEDLQEKELIVGGTGATADTVQFPKIMNAVLGTKITIIDGYPGGNDVVLAMERGEVTGRCGWSWSSVKSTRPDWIEEKKVNILVQLSTAKHPELQDVPLVMDLAKTEEDKRLLRLVFARQVAGRPIIAPPNIPEERVEALREAFMATLKDPEFVAQAEKLDMEITPVSGEELEQLVRDTYESPPEVAQRITEILQ
jgi:tripartite-type tricarboxylate transporter receptor subunit TctC